MVDSLALLAGTSLRAAILLGAAWASTSLLRSASASTRHLVWTWTLICAVLLPVAAAVVPSWPVTPPASIAFLSRSLSPASPAVSEADQDPSRLQAPRVRPAEASSVRQARGPIAPT